MTIPDTTPRELLCMICDSEYPVWSAPNDLWNRVIRRPDGSDEWDFLCPGCFTRVAAERGVDGQFVVSAGVAPEQRGEPPLDLALALEAGARVCEGRAKTLTGDAKWEAMKCARSIVGMAGHEELRKLLAAVPREQHAEWCKMRNNAGCECGLNAESPDGEDEVEHARRWAGHGEHMHLLDEHLAVDEGLLRQAMRRFRENMGHR